ncbi:MAG: (2Fe-2S)-binding protein [Acidobacteria bacterium]|nr:(2Fe-2S)-binding protein [Acidobacteriota bacterium]
MAIKGLKGSPLSFAESHFGETKAKRGKVAETKSIRLTVNGQMHELDVGSKPGQIDPAHTLVYTLRETLGLTGTKAACGQGACGACTVIMDGRAVNSCKILTIECDGKSITTIEGLKDPKTGKLDPLQQAFIEHFAFQCGFCTPGIIMTTKALLAENPHPTEEEIKEALSGNFCRCVSHYHVLKAVLSVAERGE